MSERNHDNFDLKDVRFARFGPCPHCQVPAPTLFISVHEDDVSEVFIICCMGEDDCDGKQYKIRVQKGSETHKKLSSIIPLHRNS